MDNSTLLLDGLNFLTEKLELSGDDAHAEIAAELYQVAGQVVLGNGDNEAMTPCAVELIERMEKSK